MRGALCSAVHTQQAPAQHAGGCTVSAKTREPAQYCCPQQLVNSGNGNQGTQGSSQEYRLWDSLTDMTWDWAVSQFCSRQGVTESAITQGQSSLLQPAGLAATAARKKQKGVGMCWCGRQAVYGSARLTAAGPAPLFSTCLGPLTPWQNAQPMLSSKCTWFTAVAQRCDTAND